MYSQLVVTISFMSPGLMKVKKIIGQCPGGMHEHSPVIDGWGREIRSPHASRRDNRTQEHASRSSVPPGRCEGGGLSSFKFPVMNHWATLRGLSGARHLQNALSGYLLKTHQAGEQDAHLLSFTFCCTFQGNDFTPPPLMVIIDSPNVDPTPILLD
jgi:hypothetical protein